MFVRVARSRSLVAALVTSAACAVGIEAQHVSVGVQSGTTRSIIRSTLLTDGPSPFTSRDGRLAGFTVTVAFTSWAGGDIEMLYVEKGMSGPDVFDMRSTYLEMPVLLRFTSPRALWGFAPVVQAGFAPAREISCGGVTRPPSNGFHVPAPVALDCDWYRTDRTDMGFVLGYGARWGIGRFQLLVTRRSTRGMTDIGSDWERVTLKNRSNALLVTGTIRAR